MRHFALVLAAIAILAAPLAATDLTVDDVITLHEAGLGDEIVITKIQQNGQAFDLTVDELIALKGAGVSQAVIRAMMDPGTAPAPAATPSPTAPAAAPTPAREVGVHILHEGHWRLIEPEPVNWRSGGSLKRIGTLGLHKGHLNGTVRGVGAKEYFDDPVELLIVTQEGEFASEYQLLRLDVKKDLREFRALTGGVVRTRTDSERNFIPFEAEKTGPQTYVINPGRLGRGEYGLLPPSAAISATGQANFSKIFTFGIE